MLANGRGSDKKSRRSYECNIYVDRTLTFDLFPFALLTQGPLYGIKNTDDSCVYFCCLCLYL
jgi:hypothetical protein